MIYLFCWVLFLCFVFLSTAILLLWAGRHDERENSNSEFSQSALSSFHH